MLGLKSRYSLLVSPFIGGYVLRGFYGCRHFVEGVFIDWREDVCGLCVWTVVGIRLRTDIAVLRLSVDNILVLELISERNCPVFNPSERIIHSANSLSWASHVRVQNGPAIHCIVQK